MSRCLSRLVFAVMLMPQMLAAQCMPTAVPEEVGMSSERLARIRPAMQHYLDEGVLPNLITVVACRGKVVHFEQWGDMDIEKQIPVQADTVFRMYSQTKPVIPRQVIVVWGSDSPVALSSVLHMPIHPFPRVASVGAVRPARYSGSTPRKSCWSWCLLN